MGICRAVQKKVLSIFNRVSPTTTKGIQGVSEAMPKFMLIEMTESHPKSVEKDHTLIVWNTKSVRLFGSQKFKNCFLKSRNRREISYITIQDIPLRYAVGEKSFGNAQFIY